MSEIIDIKARQIFDSRGHPTVEVDVFLEDGSMGRASVPSGASTGAHEAVEKRDGGDLLGGKGVTNVVKSVTGEISDALCGLDSLNQIQIDRILCALDGTDNKASLGANAILGVSLATAKAAAIYQNMPLYRYVGGVYGYQLPIPLMNVLNGGCHADNTLDFQEFMLRPLSSNNFSESLNMGVEVFHKLKERLKTKGLSFNVGDEGGFAPMLDSPEMVLDLMTESVSASGLIPGEDMGFALDVAATELFSDGKYYMQDGVRDASGLVKVYEHLARNYPIVSIEDGMAEDDWGGWAELTESLGAKVQLVGDDLFVTNLARLEMGIEQSIANAILIKPNQIGTLSETAFVIHEAQRAGYATVMSHRSGETEDTTIADLVVAFNCGQIKTGSLSRTDRMAKYNRLLRIAEELEAQNSSI